MSWILTPAGVKHLKEQKEEQLVEAEEQEHPGMDEFDWKAYDEHLNNYADSHPLAIAHQEVSEHLQNAKKALINAQKIAKKHGLSDAVKHHHSELDSKIEASLDHVHDSDVEAQHDDFMAKEAKKDKWGKKW